MNLKRLIPYLLINIIVSAATVLVVLALRDSQRPACPVITPCPLAAAATPLPVPPVSSVVIAITDVQGAGQLSLESVKLLRQGEGDLDLTGWRLEDGQGSTFTFPAFQLNKGAGVRINSRAGSSTALELFWSRTQPAWQTGKTITLFDTHNNVRATFSIP